MTQIPISSQMIATIGKSPNIRAMAIEVIHPDSHNFVVFHREDGSLTELREDNADYVQVSAAAAHSASTVIIFDFGKEGADANTALGFFGEYCEEIAAQYGGTIYADTKPFGDMETIRAGMEANPQVTELFLKARNLR